MKKVVIFSSIISVLIGYIIGHILCLSFLTDKQKRYEELLIRYHYALLDANRVIDNCWDGIDDPIIIARWEESCYHVDSILNIKY